MAPSRTATSRTVRPIGPAVSCVLEMGTIPPRLHRPTVGLRPTIPQALAGETIEPSVSVPIATAHKFAETAAADPELDPDGLRSNAYGFLVSPPRPLQPLVDLEPLKFAHSLRFVLPSSTAPASRNLLTINESRGAIDPINANDPAVVIMRSCVSMLSFTRTGIPCI